MSEEKFELGDLVVLKSGGPKMTVESIEVESAMCSWFARVTPGNYELKSETFAIGALSILKDNHPAQAGWNT